MDGYADGGGLSMKKRIPLALIAVILLTGLDQLVKYLVNKNFEVGESRKLIDGIFQLSYIQNRGAAWGSFSGKVVFLLVITFAILIAAIYVYIKLAGISGRKYTPIRIPMVFLISGAIGNMIDRIFRGYVVDMFDFCLINFPVFNVADIYVTCSFIVIVILILFVYKDEDLSVILRGKKDK